eukprot:1147865-Pelagomonas_calceolata.AAC.9
MPRGAQDPSFFIPICEAFCRFLVTFRGDGPLGTIMCIADTKGQVKGKVGFNPHRQGRMWRQVCCSAVCTTVGMCDKDNALHCFAQLCVLSHVDNPSADPPLYPDGKLAVGHAVGTGANTVGQAHTSCPSVETLQAMPSDRNAVGHARDRLCKAQPQGTQTLRKIGKALCIASRRHRASLSHSSHSPWSRGSFMATLGLPATTHPATTPF